MKNKIILTIFLLTTTFAQSQIFYNETKGDVDNYAQRENKSRQRISENKIHSMKTFYYKPDTANAKEHYQSAQYIYNDKGYMTEYKQLKKNGKIKMRYTNKWDDAGHNIEYNEYRKNGNLKVRLTNVYDANGNQTDVRLFWRGAIFSPHEKQTWHSIASFDEKKNMTEMKYFIGSEDKKLYERYAYSFYPDGSKKQTTQYDRKNKVKHIWNFECNPAGAQAIFKDSSNICIRYETDKDGNKLKVREENVKHKKVVRIISKYDKNENLIDVKQYDAMQRARYHTTYFYNTENRMTEYAVFHRYKNEIKERFVFHFDTAGMCIEQIAYRSSNTPHHVVKFNYAK